MVVPAPPRAPSAPPSPRATARSNAASSRSPAPGLMPAAVRTLPCTPCRSSRPVRFPSCKRNSARTPACRDTQDPLSHCGFGRLNPPLAPASPAPARPRVTWCVPPADTSTARPERSSASCLPQTGPQALTATATREHNRMFSTAPDARHRVFPLVPSRQGSVPSGLLDSPLIVTVRIGLGLRNSDPPAPHATARRTSRHSSGRSPPTPSCNLSPGSTSSPPTRHQTASTRSTSMRSPARTTRPRHLAHMPEPALIPVDLR